MSRFVMPNPLIAAPGSDLIAIGADLAPGTLLAAYRAGLFPMPVEPDQPDSRIAWYSPDPRGILPLDALRVINELARTSQNIGGELPTVDRVLGELVTDLATDVPFHDSARPVNARPQAITSFATPEMAESTPLIGEWLRTILRGGETVSSVTLTRFYGVHVWVLPALTIGFVAMHLYLVVRIGISAPPEKDE